MRLPHISLIAAFFRTFLQSARIACFSRMNCDIFDGNFNAICVSITTGVDKGAPAPQWPGKNFFVKIEGLLEPVVLNLSFRVCSNAMFTSEIQY